MYQLTSEDYENLLTFRTSLRRFLHWSETQARAAGLTPAQHQLLLAIKGHRGEHGPAIGAIRPPPPVGELYRDTISPDGLTASSAGGRLR